MNKILDGTCGAVSFTEPFNRTATVRLWSPVAYAHLHNKPPGQRTAWHRVIEELRRLRLLKDDWDGDGAAAPAVPVVETAIQEAIRLRNLYHSPPDRIAAGVNGSVVMEWIRGDRILEVEVVAPSEIDYRQGGRPLLDAAEALPFD